MHLSLSAMCKSKSSLCAIYILASVSVGGSPGRPAGRNTNDRESRIFKVSLQISRSRVYIIRKLPIEWFGFWLAVAKCDVTFWENFWSVFRHFFFSCNTKNRMENTCNPPFDNGAYKMRQQFNVSISTAHPNTLPPNAIHALHK